MKKLYVGNLPFQATEQDLSNWFHQTGAAVANITIVKDRDTGRPRGFGFVEINNDEEASRAIQSLNGQDCMGRKVVVNEARRVKVAEVKAVAVATTGVGVVVAEGATRAAGLMYFGLRLHRFLQRARIVDQYDSQGCRTRRNSGTRRHYAVEYACHRLRGARLLQWNHVPSSCWSPSKL